MILICSEHKDRSTSDVIKWLIYWDKQFVRVNKEDVVEKFEFEINNELSSLDISFPDKKIRHSDHHCNNSFWYRRGYIRFTEDQDFIDNLVKDLKFSDRLTVSNALKYEIDTLKYHSQLFLLTCKRTLGDYRKRSLNKIEMLTIAKEHGFMIPRSIVTTSRERIMEFYHDNKCIIHKPLWEVLALFHPTEGGITSYTVEIEEADILALPEVIYPSLFQEKLEKSYELRIFFFKKMIYACSIFSQMNEESKIDYRNTDINGMNRVVPYQVDDNLKNKLLAFAATVELDTGSFDFIVTPAGMKVFIEINPIGQFGFVSYSCNYYIEKDIADFLANDN